MPVSPLVGSWQYFSPMWEVLSFDMPHREEYGGPRRGQWLSPGEDRHSIGFVNVSGARSKVPDRLPPLSSL